MYNALYVKALEGASDCGGVLSYNYFSGETITRLSEGRPLIVRMPDADFSLANFMRAQLYAAMGTLKLGMCILFNKENVHLDCLFGHGGLFKTEHVGQKLMAGALNVPVTVMKTAGEGGAWGIALLAAYMNNKTNDESLEAYLAEKVFAGNIGTRIEPCEKDRIGFEEYMKSYEKGLSVEREAVKVLK